MAEKIGSAIPGIVQGGLAGGVLGAFGGSLVDKKDPLRGAAYGAGTGFLGGSLLGGASTYGPVRRLQRAAIEAVGEERRIKEKLKNVTDYAEAAKLKNEHEALIERLKRKSNRLNERINTAAGLSGFGAGLGGSIYAKHKTDSRKKVKTAADMRSLNPEQKEELKQFLKNTALIGVGTGVGTGLSTLTHMGLNKLFGPKGRWPNMVGPKMRRVLSVAGPTVLGGASLYGYHRMSKKRDELLEDARRRGRRRAAPS